MQQTFAVLPMSNIQHQQQQYLQHYQQLLTHLDPNEDHHHHPHQFQAEQENHHHHQATEQQQQKLQPHQHQHQQFNQQNHRGYTTTPPMPSSTTMSPQPIMTASLSEQQGLGGGHYTSLVTSDEFSQYCSSSEAAPSVNCSSSGSSSSFSTSSSSSRCHESNSSCVSPAGSVTNITEQQKPTPSIGVNLRVTGQCSQGGRKYMEDYFSVAYQQSENAKDLEYAFIGIYDGHGGAEAATFAKENLMMEIINQRLFWSDSDHDVLRAIREGYIATHYAMWRQQDKWPRTANGLPSTAGTTATIAFIRREKIYIGHVGDSGIVLGYQNENEHFWRAKQLTVDHKPESAEERTRIMNAGGKVVVKSGVPRVVWKRPRNVNHRGPIRQKTPVDEIPFLAVARSLGDLWSYNSEHNEFIVSPDPDVKVISINPNTFRCLIFGTDGLWNVVSPQEAVNLVHEKELVNDHLQSQQQQQGDSSPREGNQWTNPSKSLVEQALKTWSNKKMRADNTSVVTVILYPPGQGGHNNNLHPSSNTAPPPAFVQPASYGLEYSQVQADITEYNNVATYQEMAMKYLPPEEYRNFNYYSEESDGADEETDTDESDGEEPAGKLNAYSVNTTDHNGYHALHTSTWNWGEQHNNNSSSSCTNQTLNMQSREGSPKNLIVVEEEEDVEMKENDDQDDGGDDADDDDDDADADDDDDGDDDDGEEKINSEMNPTHCQPGNGNTRDSISYQNYLHIESNSDCYMNPITESYNVVLNPGRMDCLTHDDEDTKLRPASIATVITPTNSNSNSNSNSSNCQSVTPPNMHALIEEQQLYQQQCMCEEDGYSLTKLETRREQQSCKSSLNSHLTVARGDVETFKIFHQQANSSPQAIDSSRYSSSAERFYQQHTGYMPQSFQQKPLELDSLLQQEREEEQQVAFERQQMQNKIVGDNVGGHHTTTSTHNISAYACMQPINSDSEPSTSMYVSSNSSLERETNAIILDPDDLIVQEVEEDEDEEREDEEGEGREEEEGEEDEEDDVTMTEVVTTRINVVEPSVQIHEISSSSSYGELDEECENFISPRMLMTTSSRPKASQGHNRQIDVMTTSEVIYSVQEQRNAAGRENCAINNNTVLHSRRTSLKHSLPQSETSLALDRVSAARTVGRRSRTFLYQNVPNENDDRSGGGGGGYTSHRTPSGSSILTCSGMLRTPPVATSTPMSARQLRSNTNNCNSNTPTIDYEKCTLRTRNSLAKETKSSKTKTSLVKAALKYPHQHTATRKFLRATAATTMLSSASAAALIQQQHQDQHTSSATRRSLNKSTNGHKIVSHSIKSTRNNSTNTPTNTLNETQASSSTHLNLRSRQSSTMPAITNKQQQQHQMLELNRTLSGRLHGNMMATSTSSPSPLPLPPASSNTTKTTSPVIRRNSLADRRNLRSMHTRSSSRVGSSAQTTSFSKTTRSQSAGTNLAAPPPSPKMIDAAAVAAATRARSLLTQKHNADEENGGRTSVVTAIFGKRNNLRSNGLKTQESVATVAATAAGVGVAVNGMVNKRSETAIRKKFKR